ncbi:hypothetical protein IFT48_01985 [Pseudomonas fluorescens]|uniref:hypothetical protein n=1 Tax=Pseudomonas fluorescens TaxID=294 RepID=UPI001930D5D9|nr:hypothetical protein [Pseudomonas fluorescens]MBD8088732.1 hypothetical protein [Pseudomonas fluorescens]
MSFESDLEALGKVDHNLARNIRGFMTQAKNRANDALTFNDHLSRLAPLIADHKEDNPFYLSAMLVPVHASKTALPMIKFLQAHGPVLLDSMGIFLSNRVGKSQLELLSHPPVLLEVLDIQPQDHQVAMQWFGQYASVATRRLSNEIADKLQEGVSVKDSQCLVRMYDMAMRHQAALDTPGNDRKQPVIDPRAMARLLQMHSAVRLSGMTAFWDMPVRGAVITSPFQQMAKGLYGLDHQFQISLKAWQGMGAESLETLLSKVLADSSRKGLNASGTLSAGFGDFERPDIADVMRDLTTTAQLMIVKGDDTRSVIQELTARGVALEAVAPTDAPLRRTLSQNLLLATLFPFKHLWDEYGIALKDYQGSPVYLEYPEDHEHAIVGRYTGDHGIPGLIRVPAQEQLEKNFPGAVPSYHFSEDIPESEHDRIIQGLRPDIESSDIFKRARIDSSLLNPKIAAKLGDDLLLKLLTDLTAYDTDSHVEHGQIFHLPASEIMGDWLPHLSKASYEAWLESMHEHGSQEWVAVIANHRRPSTQLLSRMGGRIIDSCLSQDLGL